jgi:hypothetical protein
MSPHGEHRRSVGFLEHEGRSWSCFLVTWNEGRTRWHGYFSFRARDGEPVEHEVRTADIFLEASEAEVHAKARGLGRPLLNGLLSSALHTAGRAARRASALRSRFQTLLTENAREISDDWSPPPRDLPPEPSQLDEADRVRLRSLYTSYRLDQVVHLICLVEPAAFQDAVDTILAGRAVDFRTRDRIQFAMMVVEHLEGLLPLPPFETWARDYLDHPDAYRIYAHALHREGRLP